MRGLFCTGAHLFCKHAKPGSIMALEPSASETSYMWVCAQLTKNRDFCCQAIGFKPFGGHLQIWCLFFCLRRQVPTSARGAFFKRQRKAAYLNIFQNNMSSRACLSGFELIWHQGKYFGDCTKLKTKIQPSVQGFSFPKEADDLWPNWNCKNGGSPSWAVQAAWSSCIA